MRAERGEEREGDSGRHQDGIVAAANHFETDDLSCRSRRAKGGLFQHRLKAWLGSQVAIHRVECDVQYLSDSSSQY